MNVIKLISELRAYNVIPKLVDGKIKLSGETDKLTPEFLKELKEHKHLLIDFLTERNSEKEIPIEKIEKQSSYPTTNAQQRIWVLSQFEGGSQAYNIADAFYLKGEVQVNLLEKAFQLAVQRHESLRTFFIEGEELPLQKIVDDLEFKIAFENVEGISNTNLKEQVKIFSEGVFNLSTAPLFKVKLLQISKEEYFMLFNMHHIIGDGWSLGVLLQEVMNDYRELCVEGDVISEPLSIQFKDYSSWLQKRLNGEFGGHAREFWAAKNFRDIPALDLPTDFARRDKNTHEGALLRFLLSDEFYKKIEKLASACQTTVFNVYRSVLNIVLHKWTNQQTIIVGTPVSGRSHSQLANQIGLYVNTLPLLSNYNGDQSFIEYVNLISKDSFSTFKYQDYPLDLLIEENDIQRVVGRNPLFDVMMVVQNTAIGDGSIDKVNQHGFTFNGKSEYFKEKLKESHDVSAKFDLSFSFSADSKGDNAIDIEYKTSLFRKSTILRLFNMLELVIEQVVDTNDIALKDIKIIDNSEYDTILKEFNQPIGKHKEQNILELLQHNLSSLGDTVAVVDNDGELTYKQLDTLSNNIGTALTLGKGSKVGLFLSRSSKIIATVLGVWKSGKAYVPIDIKYPVGRIQYILNDSNVDTLVVDNNTIGEVPESFLGKCINLDELEETENNERVNPVKDKDSVAYLIYTSGSTGQPKGVEITHRNAIAFLKWSSKEFASTPYDIMFAGTSYCFDLSVFEMLFPLSQGKKIRVLESGVEISNFVSNDKNIFINTVPSVVRSLLDQQISWENVVALNMAGEPVPKIFKDQLDYKTMEVRNLYGPSEDTTYSTCYRFEDDKLAYIPIGVPAGDTHLYILDEDGNMLPIGVEGEICLSGQQIAKGYLNKPELTYEKFVDNPFVEGERMYRTGDIGKWTKEGHVAFTGRKDDQVKVRGFRIELGEIQYQLDSIKGIEQAIVVVKDVNGEKTIVAYFTPSEEISIDVIKEILGEQLPVYMIPSYFIEIDEIPMNSNGKVDKKKLPEPESSEKEIIEPKTETQQRLLRLWEQALNTTGFGIESNFFELGGHSLKATKLKGLILVEFQKELTLNELFEQPEISQMAELIDSKPIYVEQKIERIEVDSTNLIPLSYAQERLWVLTKFENASKAYHMPAAFKITGNLDKVILESALLNVIDKHESLRTLFKEKNGVAFQHIVSTSDLNFKLESITLQEQENLEKQLKNRWSTPFDLENGPLLRCALITQGTDKILSFNMHHIISDGWSVGVLFQDVMKSYALISNGESGIHSELDFQYKDFSGWQRQELTGERLQEQLNYWKNEVFAEEIQPLELPYDKLRPEIKTYNGATVHRTLPQKLSDKIIKQSTEFGVSTYMSIMANVSILLKKLSNQSDIVIGTPVSGRDSRQLQEQIGFYVNTLPIRVQTEGSSTYSTLVNDVRKNLLSSFSYQHFPFEMLVDEVQPRRDTSRSPLFDVMVVMQNFDVFENNNLQIDQEVIFEKIELSSGNTKYDLTFSFSQQENGIHLELEYNTDLFEKSTVENFVDQLERVFVRTSENAVGEVADISLMSSAERSMLLEKSNMTEVKYDTTQTIISHFEDAVSRFGEKEALRVGNKSWTYQELDERSGQLARILVEEYEVKDEDLIVLHTDRNEWMMISILACLKAGAAYVPVDPAYPVSRIEYILEDSGAKIVLADSILPEEKSYLFENNIWLDISNEKYQGNPFKKQLNPRQLAYIIYTSGTTGNPKGVLIEHYNVSRLLFNENDYFNFDENDSWTLFHSYCFDFSVWEMYGALLKGGTLVMVPKVVAQDSETFFNFLSEEKITVLNQTPTAFRSLCLTNEDHFESTPLNVRYVIFGGEALMPSTLKAWNKSYPTCQLINMYGITETTVHVTYKEIGKQEIQENKSNIGVPIPTLSCYVLDADLQPCAPGVIGELCVGGAGVARGYHNKPELTAEKFVENKFGGEGTLYRSGDFARLLNNGDIEYIGRKDEQVKIRGHRIELAEVEEGVKNLNSVEDAVVLAKKNTTGEFELIAYYILKESTQEVNLRQELSAALPSYMVPSHYIQLDEFPMTSNGKLDKKALPEVSSQSNASTEYVAAENDIQQTLIDIWEEVLGKENIGIRDNFFDLGGHSLKATRVISKIQEIYEVKIDLGSLFIDPTIEKLAEHVSTLAWMSESENEVESGEELII